MKQFDQKGGDVRIARQRQFHIVLAERNGGLAQILRGSAQDRHIAPSQIRGDNQTVEAIAFGFPGDNSVECIFEKLFDFRQMGGPAIGPFHEKVEHKGFAHPAVFGFKRNRIGILGNDLEAEIFEDRKRNRKRQRLAQAVQFDPQHIMSIVRLALGSRL